MKKLFLPLVVLAAGLSFNSNLIANEAMADKVPQVPGAAAKAAEKIDINKATLEQLSAIKGLGKKKAQAILDYRQANGEITSLEDLKSIKGLGKKTLTRLLEKFELGQ